LYRPGQPDFQAPDTKHPRELLDKWIAEAEEARAKARAARQDKEQTPQIEVKTDENGVRHYYDKKSGAFGYEVPGTDAKAALSHWFTADEPAVPARDPSIRWFAPNGQCLPNGPLDIRSGGAAQPAQTDPLGIRASLPTDPSKRPPLTAFFGGGSASQPATPQARPQPSRVQPAPKSEEDAAYEQGFASVANAKAGGVSPGKELDNAHARFSAAHAKVLSYGMLQRKRDPAGWQRAQDDLKDALSKKQEAEAFWETSLMPQPTGMPLRSH
jgi:hypothetical protein